jgi:hypothetical protein
MTEARKPLPRNESCDDAVDLIIDVPPTPNPAPPSEAEMRYMEALRERYLRGLAYREAQKKAAEGQSSPPDG